jgi:hypothetical protein
MLVKTFICEEHKEYGGLGWREKSKPHFDPYQGMAVAHDCLEHFPDDKESIEYEAMAFGAMLHVRGNIDRQSHHEQWEDIRSDCIDIFRLYRYEDRAFNSPAERMNKPLRDSDDWHNEYVERQIRYLIDTLPNFLRIENDYENEPTEGPYGDLKARMDLCITTFSRNMGGWIRHGYRRARRRWRGDSYSIGTVFSKIRDEADKYLNHATAGMS